MLSRCTVTLYGKKQVAYRGRGWNSTEQANYNNGEENIKGETAGPLLYWCYNNGRVSKYSRFLKNVLQSPKWSGISILSGPPLLVIPYRMHYSLAIKTCWWPGPKIPAPKSCPQPKLWPGGILFHLRSGSDWLVVPKETGLSLLPPLSSRWYTIPPSSSNAIL